MKKPSKRFFQCRKPGCPVKIALHYYSDKTQIDVFRKEGDEHDHSKPLRFSRHLVFKYFDDEEWRYCSGEHAVLKLGEKGIVITESQWYNFKTREAKRLKKLRTIGQLKQWVEENSGEDASKPDRMFAYRSEIQRDEEGQLVKVFLTTSRLLSQIPKSETLMIDATFKMLLIKFPVIVVGINDAGRRFHPVGIVLSNKEDSDAFEFAIRAALDAKPEHRFQNLMGDCAASITKAFKRFEEERKISSRKFCYFHISKDINDLFKRLKLPQVTSTWKGILHKTFRTAYFARYRIHSIHLLEVLANNLEEQSAPDELLNFVTSWRDEPSAWLACELNGAPTTNNALEKFNRDMKFEGGERINLSLETFLDRIGRYLSKVSKRRDPGTGGLKRPFQTDPKPLRAESESVEAFRKFFEEKGLPADGSSFTLNIRTMKRVIPFARPVPLDLEGHKRWRDSYIELGRVGRTFSCDCVAFFKCRTCRHTIAASEVLDAVGDIIVPRQKRGRHSSQHRALERQ